MLFQNMTMYDLVKRLFSVKSLGTRGEEHAVVFLRRQGYQIVERNVKNAYGSQLGEIDIVALDGNCVVFVEVKTRTSESVPLRLAISREKLRRLARIGEWYMKRGKRIEQDFRFDMVGIFVPPEGEPHVTHIQDMFL